MGGPAIVVGEGAGDQEIVVLVFFKVDVGLFVVLQESMEIAEGEATAGEVFAVVCLEIALVDIASAWGGAIGVEPGRGQGRGWRQARSRLVKC